MYILYLGLLIDQLLDSISFINFSDSFRSNSKRASSSSRSKYCGGKKIKISQIVQNSIEFVLLNRGQVFFPLRGKSTDHKHT